MRKKLILGLFPCVLATPFFPFQKPVGGQKPLAFLHINLIDATGAPAQPDMTVLISQGRIAAIGKTGRVSIPADAQRLDATGKFLIPGLWDMHTHTLRPERRDFFLSLFVANGVTGIRDMGGGDLGLRDQWTAEIDSGARLGPKISATGPILDGPLPLLPGSMIAKDPMSGRQAVIEIKKSGADFVKVYSLLPRNIYLAIADEAKKEGIPFVGHVPEYVSAADASDAGQKSMEHLFGVLITCSTRETELRQKVLDAVAAHDRRAFAVARRQAFLEAVDSYSGDKAQNLFRRFVANGTWQCPTLIYFRGLAFAMDPESVRDERLKYLPASFTADWVPRPGTRSVEATENLKKIYRKYLELVGQMHRAGVKILAGTDTLGSFCLPGFGLHDELALFVQAGLTPMEALQTATLNPAAFLGKRDSMGTVEVNRMADLVLLDADPLEDIRNTQKINSVVVNGRLLGRKTLDELFAQVELAANNANVK
jgi:imidazolonepropionase-like amidohydrolase